MPRPLALAPGSIACPGPGRPRGHARPVLEWALRTRLTPQPAGSTSIEAVLQPERRLMIAVLDAAIGSFLKVVRNGSRHPRDVLELERWFDDPDRTWLFSFLRICETLDLEPDRVRHALARWCVCQSDFFARRTAAKLQREKVPRTIRPALPDPSRDRRHTG
jgi:hypothetical protein